MIYVNKMAEEHCCARCQECNRGLQETQTKIAAVDQHLADIQADASTFSSLPSLKTGSINNLQREKNRLLAQTHALERIKTECGSCCAQQWSVPQQAVIDSLSPENKAWINERRSEILSQNDGLDTLFLSISTYPALTQNIVEAYLQNAE